MKLKQEEKQPEIVKLLWKIVDIVLPFIMIYDKVHFLLSIQRAI